MTRTAAAFRGPLLLCLAATPALPEIAWEVDTALSRKTAGRAVATVELYPTLRFSRGFDSGARLEARISPELYFEDRGGAEAEPLDPFLGGEIALSLPAGLRVGVYGEGTHTRNAAFGFTGGAAYVFAEGAWGTLYAGDLSGSTGALSVLPTMGTVNVFVTDLALADACPTEADHDALRWVSPESAGGWTLGAGLSGLDEPDAVSVAVKHRRALGEGEATAALWLKSREAAGGEDLLAHLGLRWVSDRWDIGIAAGRVAAAEAGRDEWGVQAGIAHDFGGGIKAVVGVTAGRLGPEDGGGIERAAGVAVSWQAVPERLLLDAGVVRRRVDGQAAETAVTAGVQLMF